MQKVTVVSLALGLAVLALASLAMAATEAAVRASPSFKQGDASVVAVYITNRPYNCTHLDPPNITFCNDSKLGTRYFHSLLLFCFDQPLGFPPKIRILIFFLLGYALQRAPGLQRVVVLFSWFLDDFVDLLARSSDHPFVVLTILFLVLTSHSL